MRKTIIIAALCILGLASIPAQAETQIELSKGTQEPPKKHRPHDEEIAVVCYYDNGDISISFESYEGMATATVTNVFTAEAESWNFSTATQPSVHYIGTAPGTYTISITTRENTYEGIFSID